MKRVNDEQTSKRSDGPAVERPSAAGEYAEPIVVVPTPHEAQLPLDAYARSIALTAVESGPAPLDPEREALRRRLEEQRRNGEWESWFVDLAEQADAYMSAAGLPRQVREAAVPSLRRLYPPKVCRAMLRHPLNSQIVDGLFNRWPPYVVSLIRIGALLDVARPWSDRKLLGDLRSFENFAPARTELEIWVALAKARYRFDREPLGPDGRRPDFAVRVAGCRYIVEVKSLLASDGERLADSLRTSMLAIGGRLRRPGVTVSVLATATLRALLESALGRVRIAGDDGRDATKLLARRVAELG